jgi:hypothetical protein
MFVNVQARYSALLIGLLLAGSAFLPLQALAQTSAAEAAQINEQDLSFEISPEIPGPFQDVTITANSYITNLGRAFFLWKKDGQTVLSQTGAYKYTFTTKDVGQQTLISVTIVMPTGENIQKQFSFNPSEINLIWEGANSYTPPFYRGRALPSSEGLIRVVAIPQINNGKGIIDPSKYVYRWKKGDNVVSDSSGYNKSSLVYAQDYLNPSEEISVMGQDSISSQTASGSVTVRVSKPEIILYTRDAIRGIDWNHAITNSLDVTSAERTIIAIPYFFSPANPNSGQLNYTWSINDTEVSTPTTPNMLTLKSGLAKGTSSLKVRIENLVTLFLDAEKTININLK